MATAKIKPEPHHYVEGSISRIKLEDFLTYDSVEFRPGPYLNVIIGPNGTGKSTIVCGICLGLAGKPSILGRANNPMEFIKHGCQKAVIEIELVNKDGENKVIRREILKNNTSHWSVNGRQATQKAVEEAVLRMNIQVNNLCQFLPQDKVADFAKMSQQELLESTEKAVGPTDMYENHCRLKKAREDARNLELKFKNTKEHLDQELEKNSRLEQDVKNYEKRQHHLEKIKVLQMKRPWLEYEEKRKLHIVEKELKEKMAGELSKARQEHKPLKDRLDKARAEHQSLEAAMKKKTEQIKLHANKAATEQNDIEKLGDKITEIQDELKNSKATEHRRRKRMQDLTTQLDALKNELNNLDDTEDVGPRIETCNQEIRRVNRDMTNSQTRAQDIRSEITNCRREIANLQSELQQLQDVSNRRLEQLRGKHKDTYSAILWLRSNKHQFTSTIHEPMAVTLNVTDPNHAKYIEAHVSGNDLKSFVCENSDDMKLFLRIMRDEQKLKVNAVCMPNRAVDSFRPKVPIDTYRRHGFFSYIRELVDCPDAVMRYLCLLYLVHQIPVGDRRTKDTVENVISSCPELRSFYTENHQYSIKESRYTKEVSSRCTEIRRPTWLTITKDTTREKDVQRSLQEKQRFLADRETMERELRKNYTDLEAAMNRLRNEKKDLIAAKDMRRSLEQRIKAKEQSIASVESERIDIEAEERAASAKVRNLNLSKCKLLMSFKDHIQQCVNMSMEKVRFSLRLSASGTHVNKIEFDLREQNSALQAMEREFADLKERVKNVKATALQLLAIAKKATSTQKDEELSPELKRAFDSCPKTLEEIDAAIHEVQARADCTLHTDERVVHEYNNRKKEITRLMTDVTKVQNSITSHQDEVETIKAQWFQPLQDLIQRINTGFSFFFQSMKCAGEVDLNIPENPEDYEKYGVRIKVKYRDNELLRELNPYHQSGGERSVATVLYMMALQELTKCPFRCVDEINQGMDPQNERKVFELVVRTVCKRNTSQYFLLTPKLLPDLEYSENMTILCVYNGHRMLNHTEWNAKKFLKRRSRLLGS